MKTGNYLIIKESGNSLFVDKTILDLFADGGSINPILWCRDGQYCLIPKEVVQNVIEFLGSLHAEKRIPPKLYFFWNQGIPISNQAGRALLGE